MTKTVKTLATLLVLQGALFFWFSAERQGGGSDKNKNLLAIELSSVNKIVVSGGEKDSCEIVKAKGVWILPSYYDFPVSASKVESLTQVLGGLKKSWPAGRTLLAAKQFLTTKEKFEKKIDLYKGEELLTTLYIGSSPSFKKVHLRVEGDDNTYVGAFSSYEYPSKNEAWADPSLYRVLKSDLASFEKGNLKLVASEDGKSFSWSDLTSSERMNRTEANLIVNAAIHPRFTKVLGTKDYKTGKKVLSYKLMTRSGSSMEFNFFRPFVERKPEKEGDEEGEKNLVLKVSTEPYSFEVARSEVSDIIGLERKLLLKTEESRAPKTVSLKEEASH